MPENWPPETLADSLPIILGWMEAAPDRVGWFGWPQPPLRGVSSRRCT